ncbi:hypothetical protein PF006_g30416, partial [Phytophthora fragariae]
VFGNLVLPVVLLTQLVLVGRFVFVIRVAGAARGGEEVRVREPRAVRVAGAPHPIAYKVRHKRIRRIDSKHALSWSSTTCCETTPPEQQEGLQLNIPSRSAQQHCCQQRPNRQILVA